MAGPYNVKTKARTIPDFNYKDNVGTVHPVYWQLEEGRVCFRAVDIWQAVTKSTGHFSKSHLRLTDHEAKRLKEYKFSESPATRKVCALSISLALTVCERLTPSGVPTEVEKWIRDQLCPAVGEVVPSSAATMLARAKKKTAQIVKSPSPPPGKIKKTPLVPPSATPADLDLFAQPQSPAIPPNPLSPEEQIAILTEPASPPPPPQDPAAKAALAAKAAPLLAMLRAELDDETLAYDLVFPDAAPEESQFHGQGYALPPVSPVPGQVLWPERLGVACDDLDRLFSLTAEEAARLEPCLWMHKSPDGTRRRVLDQMGWAKMLAFPSVGALPDQHKSITALFEGAALVFGARKPEADPGCITVISSSEGSTVAVSQPAQPKSPEAPAYPANAPQPDIAAPAPPKAAFSSPPPLPGRKISYWSLQSKSVPVRAAQDGAGSLWVAKVDLERIVGEEGAWPYDVRDMPSGRIMNDSKVYTAICEKAIPLIAAGASNGTKTEALKFAKWWAETVQVSFGQTKPINQVWPVPGERVVSSIMQARPFSYVYAGRLVGTIWVAEDAIGGLWIARRDLETVFGGLQTWPLTVRQATRSIIENEYGKYPAISEEIIGDLVKAGKIAVSREMALDFELWFNQDVAPKFGSNAAAAKPPAPVPPSKSARPPLEGELLDFLFKGIRYEVIVAVDDDDDIWAEIGPLEKVFGAVARDWSPATQKALVRDIAFKGGVRPAIQEKWIEIIADCSPFKPRAEAFTAWWLAEVMPYFDTTDLEPAPQPAAAPQSPVAPALPKPEDAEFVEVLEPKPVSFFLPVSIKPQEADKSMSYQARELAKLLSSMADALDNKDRENAELRAQLAERDKDREKLQAIQAALGLK